MDALKEAGGDAYEYTLAEGRHGYENGWDNRLVYNSDRVALINSAHVPFKAQDGSGLPREFVWGTFESKVNRHRFLVYTTHLEPGGTAELKKAQWDQIRANAVVNRKVDGKTLPVFIVGDYNTSKFRQPADVMLPKMKSSGFGDVLGQTYRSYTVVGQRAKTKSFEYYNSFNDCKTSPSRVNKGRIGNNIDWIFATNSLQIPAWRTLVRLNGSVLQTPIPSDHFLISIQALLP
jgi:endonuclease/exonuclease/phosphatase family metal-dependent hydrolase